MFVRSKEFEALERRMDSEFLFIAKNLNEIVQQVREFRNQVEEIVKKTSKPNDLPVYNLSDGLSAAPTLLQLKLTSEMTDAAKARMKEYIELRNSLIVPKEDDANN